MAERISVTQADVDGLGKKLDEFQTVLTDRERSLMEMAMTALKTELRKTLAGGTPAPTPGKPSVPPLSAGFRDAFEPGVGKSFTISSAEAESVGIGVVY